ncbi:MAG: HAD family hydrolase [Clostridia bacterium]|nr:HAD family hydrolase [Clostridia bacterium]
MQALDSFVPKHQKLLCFDSDGTVIDAMNVKHNRCHGRAFLEEWDLTSQTEAVQKVWSGINLYEKTRGINRFLALYTMLLRMEGAGLHTDEADLALYRTWLDKDDLSNISLKEEIGRTDSAFLKKVLRWSESVNKKIAALKPDDKPPFENVRAALAFAKDKVDLAIISSSNLSAITEEWDSHGLLEYPSFITSQEIGTKDDCIARILEKGYRKEDVLMVGDAYPDVHAAESNGVWYYPILVRHEAESWAELKDRYLPLFLADRFGTVQEELLARFAENFSASLK